MMETIVSSPLFSITLSIAAYAVGLVIYRKTRLTILNPLLLAIVIVCAVVMIFHISYKDYMAGGQFITLLLTPATVVLAVPLYDQLKLIKRYAPVILVSISIGSVASMSSVYILCKVFGMDKILIQSLMAKSVTTAIAIGITQDMHGIQAVTVVATLLSGIFGAVLGPQVFKLLRVKNRVAVGLALGTASHAVGTSKALELGEDEGAMSSLSICVAGIITVICAPLLFSLFASIWK
ncbi:MAG: LrgB family protein [Ethanoligenens sp.]|uniref:LrgB family protein n=1 Tax=Ethanoligenens sp. TaxID=2099655 RepID=UPI0039ED2234